MSERQSPVRALQLVAGLDIGQTYGGAERFALELALAFDRSRVAPTVGVLWRQDTPSAKEWERALTDAGIASFYATDRPPTRDFAAFRTGLRAIVRRCGAERFDLVHAHHEGGALAALWARRVGATARAIRTIQVPLQREWGDGPAAALMRLITSRALFPLLLDAEVVVSSDHANRLRRRFAARLARKSPQPIPSCVSAEIVNAAAAGSFARDANEGPVFGAVGRLTEQKNFATLIEAAAIALPQMPGARVLIVGDGALRSELRALADKLDIGQRVEFVGAQTRVAEFYRRMDVFVLPSLWEGLPLALLDAMASGLACIASDIPGNRDALRGGQLGWLVPARDATALASAMLRASHSEARTTLGRAAREVALAEYSPQVIAARHADLYARLLAIE